MDIHGRDIHTMDGEDIIKKRFLGNYAIQKGLFAEDIIQKNAFLEKTSSKNGFLENTSPKSIFWRRHPTGCLDQQTGCLDQPTVLNAKNIQKLRFSAFSKQLKKSDFWTFTKIIRTQFSSIPWPNL